MPPQPQPTSSSRSPGFSRSFSNTSRYLFSCASSSVASGVRVAGAGVGHRRAEHPLVERVRHVVVVVDRLGVTSLAVPQALLRRGASGAAPPAAAARSACRCSMPIERTMLASTRAGGRLKSSLSASALSSSYGIAGVHAVRFEVARHVGAGQPEFAGRGGQIGGAARGHQVQAELGVVGSGVAAVVGGELQRQSARRRRSPGSRPASACLRRRVDACSLNVVIVVAPPSHTGRAVVSRGRRSS